MYGQIYNYLDAPIWGYWHNLMIGMIYREIAEYIAIYRNQALYSDSVRPVPKVLVQ